MSDLTVSWYQVVRDRPLPEGGTLMGEPVSERYARRDDADAALDRIRKEIPDAYTGRAEFYPRTEAERDELVATVV